MWVAAVVGVALVLALLPVVWVFACAVWTEGRADSPSELVRARRRLQHAGAWAEVDGWLEYQLDDRARRRSAVRPLPPRVRRRAVRRSRSQGPGRLVRGVPRADLPRLGEAGGRPRRARRHPAIAAACVSSRASAAPSPVRPARPRRRRISPRPIARTAPRSPVSSRASTGRISRHRSRPWPACRSRVATPNRARCSPVPRPRCGCASARRPGRRSKTSASSAISCTRAGGAPRRLRAALRGRMRAGRRRGRRLRAHALSCRARQCGSGRAEGRLVVPERHRRHRPGA